MSAAVKLYGSYVLLFAVLYWIFSEEDPDQRRLMWLRYQARICHRVATTISVYGFAREAEYQELLEHSRTV